MKLLRPFRYLLLALLPVISSAARAADPASPLLFTADKSKSQITYFVVHKLHKVSGVSRQVDGKVKLVPEGATQVAVSVPVESFDSGNVNRDAHMKEIVEAARFPQVEIKAVANKSVIVPTSFPTTGEATFKAQLKFHGIQKLLDLPVKMTWNSADQVHAEAAFSISLDEFKVERPSLLFAKVEDAVRIEVDVLFNKAP